MTSFLAFRRAASFSSPALFPRPTAHLRLAACSCFAPFLGRSFNSSAQMKRQDEEKDDKEDGVMSNFDAGGRWRNRSMPSIVAFFPDAGVYVRYMPMEKVSHLLNLMELVLKEENHGSPASAAAQAAALLKEENHGFPASAAAQAATTSAQAAAKGNVGFAAAQEGGGEGAAPRCKAREDGEALNLTLEMPGVHKQHVKVMVEDNMLTVKGERKGACLDIPGFKYAWRREIPVFKVGEIKAEMKNGVLKVVVPKVKLEDSVSVLVE